MKQCGACKEIKALSEFNRDKGFKDGLRKNCKVCVNKRRNELMTKDKYRNRHLQRTYGITTEIYNEMFNEQDGKCSICLRHQSELKHKLHVDHCHKTNKVRSLLCFNCNQALGNVSDSIERLNKAIDYLRKHK
jgi:hypothetical protein